MKTLTLSLALATSFATQLRAEAPQLEGAVGLGVGVGIERYYGTFGDHGTPYVRAILSYHPTEWLGTRVTGGYGEIDNDKQLGASFETEWFSNLGMDLVLQPQIGLGAFRPYVASGLSTTFGTSKLDGNANHDLDWNLYIPVEAGLEFLIARNLSIWAWGETYAYMQDWNKIDGVPSKGNYWERRDDLQKFGVGFSFLIGSKSDADGDGIVDGIDQCPATPKGIKIDLEGCPLDGDKDGVPDYKDLCPITAWEVAVDAYGCAVDSDKDNVLDNVDKCSNTPFGTKVDVSGCPVAATDADKDGASDAIDKCPGTLPGTLVDAVGCPLDSDKDGASDNIDKCPGTPVGLKVDAAGCVPVADADHDGIADSLDKCPGTRTGVRVDTNGCTLILLTKGAKLIMDGIVFKTGSAVIDNVSTPVLGRAVVAISQAPDAKIEIAGFTDNVGKESYNQRLSERRAWAVKGFLVKAGIPSSQLTVRGYGESEPVTDNSSVESRAENRRIEFRVQ